MNYEINKLNELFENVLGLKTMDLTVFLSLKSDKVICSYELAKTLKRNQSTIQRCLTRLVLSELVYRRSVCLCDGKKGRFFAYIRVDKETLKQIFRDKIQKKYDEQLALIASI
ncbi:hypothetical protein GQ473_07460 [archaeon]|nr:hypothetical protein [archaeon]